MIIRLVIENLFSFGERKEFTTIPNKRLKTLEHHKYEYNGFPILKTSSIYGANGAGKSNLIKSLELFQKLVVREKIPFRLRDSTFKFHDNPRAEDQILAIEFLQDQKAFYYGMVINNDIIRTEELYLSGLGKEKDRLIFERKTNEQEQTEINFHKKFEEDDKSQILKSVLIEDFVKPNETILKLLANRDNRFLTDVKLAYTWFADTLQIITPDAKPNALAHKIDVDHTFKTYAKELMRSFNIGITELTTDKKKFKDVVGEEGINEFEELITEVVDSPKQMIGLSSNKGNQLIIVKENEDFWMKALKVGHVGRSNKSVLFELEEESDGTIRLLDFLPAFKDIISNEKVIIIDEIERSVHPLLIKELIQKFSLDDQTDAEKSLG